MVVTNDHEVARNILADVLNQLLLIGSSNVVSNLIDFHDYIKPSGQEEYGFSSIVHDRLLKELIKAMRKDLYKI